MNVSLMCLKWRCEWLSKLWCVCHICYLDVLQRRVITVSYVVRGNSLSSQDAHDILPARCLWQKQVSLILLTPVLRQSVMKCTLQHCCTRNLGFYLTRYWYICCPNEVLYLIFCDQYYLSSFWLYLYLIGPQCYLWNCCSLAEC